MKSLKRCDQFCAVNWGENLTTIEKCFLQESDRKKCCFKHVFSFNMVTLQHSAKIGRNILLERERRRIPVKHTPRHIQQRCLFVAPGTCLVSPSLCTAGSKSSLPNLRPHNGNNQRARANTPMLANTLVRVLACAVLVAVVSAFVPVSLPLASRTIRHAKACGSVHMVEVRTDGSKEYLNTIITNRNKRLELEDALTQVGAWISAGDVLTAAVRNYGLEAKPMLKKTKSRFSTSSRLLGLLQYYFQKFEILEL